MSKSKRINAVLGDEWETVKSDSVYYSSKSEEEKKYTSLAEKKETIIVEVSEIRELSWI